MPRCIECQRRHTPEFDGNHPAITGPFRPPAVKDSESHRILDETAGKSSGSPPAPQPGLGPPLRLKNDGPSLTMSESSYSSASRTQSLPSRLAL